MRGRSTYLCRLGGSPPRIAGVLTAAPSSPSAEGARGPADCPLAAAAGAGWHGRGLCGRRGSAEWPAGLGEGVGLLLAADVPHGGA